MNVRDYRTEDREGLEALVATVPDETVRAHARFGHVQKPPLQTRTVVAAPEPGSPPVGFASFYQNQLHYHPHDFRVSVVVAPVWQRRGVGRALHSALLERLPHPVVRLRTLIPETAGESAFLTSLSYRPLLRSFSPELAVGEVESDTYRAALSALAKRGYHLTSLASLNKAVNLNKAELHDRLVELCLEAYADIHTYSPPTGDLDMWKDIFLEDCRDEAFFVAMKNGEPVGFSSLQAGESARELESMWDGVARSERALAYPVRLALKLCEVEYARTQDVETLIWEVDSVDLVGMQLMNTLPFKVPPAYEMWALDITT